MKNRKTISVLIAVILTFLSFSMTGTAYGDDGAGGFHVPTFLGYITTQTGDIQASDARAVLMRSAYLAELPDVKNIEYAADVDFDGRITAQDARIILRVSARLDVFNINIKKGGTFTFGYVENLTSSHIDYVAGSDKLRVERTIEYAGDYAPGNIGLFDRHTFTVTADEPGEYIFKIVRYGFLDEPKNTNVSKITVA